MIVKRFKINYPSNSEIDYIKPKVRYSKNSTTEEEVMIKFRKKT